MSCKLFFNILSVTLILCDASISKKNPSYCIVPPDSTGIFVYDPRYGKDDPYVGVGTHSLASTFKLKKSSTFFQDWTEADSTQTNLVPEPIVDQRWEHFLNNHVNEITIQKTLRSANSTLFLSLRLDKKLLFLHEGWNHLKVNRSGTYSCDGNICEFPLELGLHIYKYYLKISSPQTIWKLQKHNYFYTHNETKTLIYQNCASGNNDLCFSFYFAMCPTCELTLTIQNKQFSIHATNASWVLYNYCIEKITKCVNISLETKVSKNEKNPFWAIDETWYLFNTSRNCGKDVRYREVYSQYSTCEDALNRRYPLFEKIPDCCGPKENISDFCGPEEIKIEQPEVQLYPETSITYWWILIVWVVVLVPLLCLFIFKKRKQKALGETKDMETLLLNNIKESEVIKEMYTAKKRTNFGGYVRKICDQNCDELTQQFNQLPDGYLKESKVGRMRKNLRKNNFQSTYPYDENRVKLKTGICHASDYINASYVQGFYNYREYIVAQNPLQNTISDFWNMIWQESVNNIVMVTKKNENCYYYWPVLNTTNSHNGVNIYSENFENFGLYTQHKFLVTKKLQLRKVNLLHYHDWDEDDLMLSSQKILPFIDQLTRIPHNSSPVVFHSASGAGRSGTLLLVDMVLRSLPVTQTIDVYNFTKNLRHSRANMVATLKQYTLAHVIIKDYLHNY